MDTQKQIHQYLEQLTRDFKPDPDYRVQHFLKRLGLDTLNGLDAYCFRSESENMIIRLGFSGTSLSLIHPLPNSKRALCIGLIRVNGEDRISYNISAGTFDISRTAGDPIDLAAVRMEKVIIDICAGETPEHIRMHGMYRDYQGIFQNSYVKKIRIKILDELIGFFPKSEKQKKEADIIHDLRNLETMMLWLIENPPLNRLRSREAFNY